MARAIIEHVNLNVSDPERSAEIFKQLFGWHVRWQGAAGDGQLTIHVGDDHFYLALHANPAAAGDKAYPKGRPLNHVGLCVDDLDAIEARVHVAGLTPFGHDDYVPGRRFYFLDHDNIEFEIVSYATPRKYLEEGPS